jgi:hypothetical protein
LCVYLCSLTRVKGGSRCTSGGTSSDRPWARTPVAAHTSLPHCHLLYWFQCRHSTYNEHLRTQNAPGQTNTVNNACESSKCQLKSSVSASHNIHAFFLTQTSDFKWV